MKIVFIIESGPLFVKKGGMLNFLLLGYQSLLEAPALVRAELFGEGW